MTLLRNVVAGQRDDVGLQAIRRFNRAFDLFAVGKRAMVNVGKLDDTETVERFRQAIELNSLVLDSEHVRLTERGAGDVGQTQSQGT